MARILVHDYYSLSRLTARLQGMADKKDDVSANVNVVEVKPPDPDKVDQDYLKAQNEALMHYRATGDRGVYVDPARDQEPDIAPEIGVSPAPDQANPKAPDNAFSASSLDPNKNPVVKSVARKTRDNKEASEAFSEYVRVRQEAFDANTPTFGTAPAQPVYTVDAPANPAVDDGSANRAAPGPDESPKTAQGDARATA